MTQINPISRMVSPKFRTQILERGFSKVEIILSAEELRETRERVEKILSGQSDFPEAAMASERGGHQKTRKLKDLAENDPYFDGVARNELILDHVEQILGPDIKLHASIGWMKPPRVGSPKSPHQDSAYWTHISPPEFLICWIALDDSTLDNGCLNFLPGSHREGVVSHEMQDELRVPDSAIDYNKATAVPVKAGGASFHLGRTIHWSGANHTDRPRRAISFAYMSAKCEISPQLKGSLRFPLLRGRSYEGKV